MPAIIAQRSPRRVTGGFTLCAYRYPKVLDPLGTFGYRYGMSESKEFHQDQVIRAIESARERMSDMYPDDTKHRDGVAWDDAPAPSVFHRCHVQTEGWIGFSQIQRCACGAMRTNRSVRPVWHDKNQRAGYTSRFVARWLLAIIWAAVILAGLALDNSVGEWMVALGSIVGIAAICRVVARAASQR